MRKIRQIAVWDGVVFALAEDGTLWRRERDGWVQEPGIEAELKKHREQAIKPSSNAEKIYELYPRKVGRDIALKAITKALIDVGYESLESTVKAYRDALQGEEIRYVPHPATWFNQGRYKDDPKSWKKDGKLEAPARAFEIVFGGAR